MNVIRYMNFKTVFLTLALPVLFFGCLDTLVDDSPVVPGSGEKMIPLVLKLKDMNDIPTPTYGTTKTDYTGGFLAGTQWEDSIQDVTVYIFDNMFFCEKTVTSTDFIAGPVMVKTGIKNIITVVNGASKIAALPMPGDESTTTWQALRKMLTDVPSPLAPPTSPFLMTGEMLNVPLPDEVDITTPYIVPIIVERACAKITFKVTKSGLALSHNIDLTKIEMYQGANRVALLETPNPNPTTQYTVSNRYDFAPGTGTVQDESLGIFCEMDSAFYTYESLCGTDKDRGVKIVIEAAVNSPTNIRTAEFYLGELKLPPPSTDTTYNIYRNHWYNVNVDIPKPGLDSVYVTIRACPWNVADTITANEGIGAEFRTANPLKLVKPYTMADTIPAPQILAIDQHSKGASWIEMKVTQGALWMLDVKDSIPGSSPRILPGRNEDVYGSVNGLNWQKLPIYGTGVNGWQRVYIYRPYKENNEPAQGPSLYAALKDNSMTDYRHKQDFIIQPRDTTPIPTNCYVMRPRLAGNWPVNETRAYIPLAGVYRVWEDYLLANGAEIPNGTISPAILWEDNPGVVNDLQVINGNKRDSAYLYAESGVSGNAVVAMMVGGVIYWSFHLWVTEYNPYEAAGEKHYSPHALVSNVFMDRDLGSLFNGYDDTGKARGLFYQFGRKDPFRGGTGWTDVPKLGYTMEKIPLHSGAVRPLDAIPASIHNPEKFYTRMTPGSSDTIDWSLNNEDPNLWVTKGGRKTAFDPCPEGWRIPIVTHVPTSYFPWAGKLIEGSGGPDRLAETTYGMYSPLVGYYPASGYIGSISPSGLGLFNTQTHTYVWSSYAWPMDNTAQAFHFSLPMTSLGNTLIEKSYGASVRCVVDYKYLQEKGGSGLFGRNTDNLINHIVPPVMP